MSHCLGVALQRMQTHSPLCVCLSLSVSRCVKWLGSYKLEGQIKESRAKLKARMEEDMAKVRLLLLPQSLESSE